MNDNWIEQRRAQFKTNHLLWVALIHFLPANLVEELSAAIVDIATKGKVSLGDLFNMRSSQHPTFLAAWVIKIRPNSRPFERYLQDLVRSFVWQNDHTSGWIASDLDESEAAHLRDLEAASKISSLDFGTVGLFRETIPEALRSLMAAVISLRETLGEGNIEDIADAATAGLEGPLNGLVLKHLGDLCGDADEWSKALDFYRRAHSKFICGYPAAWEDLVDSLKGITSQSIATATWFTKGAPAAVAYFALDNDGIGASDATSLGSINASTDAFFAASDSDDFMSIPDTRAAVLLPPQLLEANHISLALQYWIDGKHAEAQRWFWAVLRRQIALGSATYSRQTKAYYGRSVIDGLIVKQTQSREPDVFWLGVRLLIESGLPNVVGQMHWPEYLIEIYGNTDLILKCIEYTNRCAGAQLQRTYVVVTLFGKWLQALAPDALKLAEVILQFIARCANSYEWSFFTSRNLSGAAFDALKEISRTRPEFRILIAKMVTEAVVSKTAASNFQAVATALETACLYLDVLDSGALRAITDATLNSLRQFASGSGPWPVIQPALTLLSSDEVGRLCSKDNELRSHVNSVLLRYSLETETENARLMYLLREVDPGSIEDQIEAKRLESVVAKLRKKTSENASSTEGIITALLVAPMIAGLDGIRDAVEGLRLILESAANGHPRISFSWSYRPLLLLADRKIQLARDLSITDEEMRALVEPLFRPLIHVWQRAYSEPTIFAGFSIPPRTAPNPTYVHNWTFASIAFARSFELISELDEAISGASRNPSLQTPIAVARAIRIMVGDAEPFDTAAIMAEKREPFYAALGQRLVLLNALPLETRKTVIQVLLEQCFNLGPRGLDAGIFSAALELGVKNKITSRSEMAYRLRLDNDRDLRLSLAPMLEAIKSINTSERL